MRQSADLIEFAHSFYHEWTIKNFAIAEAVYDCSTHAFPFGEGFCDVLPCPWREFQQKRG